MRPELGQHGEFVELIHEHQGILHKVCWIYALDPADREDLFQDMVMQLWRSFSSFRGQSSFSTWMYRVALNTALMHRRKNSRTVQLQSSGDEPVASPRPDRAESEEDIELLHRCIQELPQLDRAIILLYLEQHGYDEIADITGLTRTNVSVRIVRTKDRLRELLAAKGYTRE
jgi:RNA polymerase sigma-70 factor (ECF subfamily)